MSLGNALDSMKEVPGVIKYFYYGFVWTGSSLVRISQSRYNEE